MKMNLSSFMPKKKTSNKIATGVALGMVAGVTLGALGAAKISGVSSTKIMKNAKKSFKKNAAGAMNTAQNIIDSIPKFMS